MSSLQTTDNVKANILNNSSRMKEKPKPELRVVKNKKQLEENFETNKVDKKSRKKIKLNEHANLEKMNMMMIIW